MMTWEERNDLLVSMAKAGARCIEIKKALDEAGWKISKQRVNALMKKFNVREESRDVRRENTNKKQFDRVAKKAGTFKLKDVGSPKYMAARHKFRIKKGNCLREVTPFDLEFEDLVWPDVCPIFGIPLDYTTPGRSDNSVSFDQINPGGGYVKGNVMVMSWRANRIKNDGTAEEHRLIAEFMELDFEEVFNGIIGRLEKQRQEEKDNWKQYVSNDFKD